MSTILIFFAVLSVLVLAHEFGHYMAARLCGVKAEEFGFGFPPRLIGFVRENGRWQRVPMNTEKTFASTIWSINWLPLGGFVRMKGEEGKPGETDAFVSKSLPKRFFILAAGVCMNWLVATLIFAAGFMFGVPSDLEGAPAHAKIQGAHIELTQIVTDSAADKAGLKAGDTILAIQDRPATTVPETLTQLQTVSLAGTPFSMKVSRKGQEQTVSVTPAFVPALNRPGVGVGIAHVGVISFPWYQAIPQGAVMTYQYTKAILFALGSLVKTIFVHHEVPADVSGPVGIAVMTGKVVEQGMWPLLQFAALLSINLAVVNFLPIPALDGGRALFVLIESIRRKRFHPNWEAMIHRVGFMALLSLVLLVTIHDVRQYGGLIWHGLKSMVGL